MSTPEQETSFHTFSKSGLVPPQPPAPYKKPRSNSINTELEPEQKYEFISYFLKNIKLYELSSASSDETTPTMPPEKLDVAGLRKKFEVPQTPEISQPHISKKRTSTPGSPSFQTNTSNFTSLSASLSNNSKILQLIKFE
jgi:hypothetical protein